MPKKKEPKVENRQVAILKDGLGGPFWKVIRDIVENEKQELEIEIMENETISDKERDDLRRWRNFLAYFVTLPEKCIESLEAKPVDDGSGENMNNEDPYDDVISDVRKKIINAK